MLRKWEADAVDSLGLWETLRQNRFYATNGPEIHLERLDELTFRLRCSVMGTAVNLVRVGWMVVTLFANFLRAPS